jgi:hypothetical protein
MDAEANELTVRACLAEVRIRLGLRWTSSNRFMRHPRS